MSETQYDMEVRHERELTQLRTRQTYEREQLEATWWQARFTEDPERSLHNHTSAGKSHWVRDVLPTILRERRKAEVLIIRPLHELALAVWGPESRSNEISVTLAERLVGRTLEVGDKEEI